MTSWIDFIKPLKNNVQYTDFQKNPERTYKQKKTRKTSTTTKKEPREKTEKSGGAAKTKVTVNVKINNGGGGAPGAPYPMYNNNPINPYPNGYYAGNNSLISKYPSVPIHSGANNISISEITDLQKQLSAQMVGMTYEMSKNKFGDNTALQSGIEEIKQDNYDMFEMLAQINKTGDINKTLGELNFLQAKKYEKKGRPTEDERQKMKADRDFVSDSLYLQDPDSVLLNDMIPVKAEAKSKGMLIYEQKMKDLEKNKTPIFTKPVDDQDSAGVPYQGPYDGWENEVDKETGTILNLDMSNQSGQQFV